MANTSGTTRRDFLRAGALGTTGLLLPDLLRARAANADISAAKDTSIIWLFLNGGPSQYETFDPKPGNPAPHRSVVGTVKTNVPGTHLGGLFHNLSKHAHQFSLIRSFTHSAADHAAATHWLMTGHDYPAAANPGTPQNQPGFGAMVSRYRGPMHPKTSIPNNVKLDYVYGEGPDWLGATHSPFDIRGNIMSNLTPRISTDRLADRRSLLKSFDKVSRDIDSSGMMSALDDFEVRAVDLIRSRSREAFDVTREDPRLRDRYGPGLGEKLLQARRLAEAGVGLITVRYGSWDSHGANPSVNHGTIEEEMHKYVPELDRALSVFLDDLYDRGLQEKVLVAVVGEFGRSPGMTKEDGRDHWPLLGNQLLAGGGMKMGKIIGSSSQRGDEPKSNPVSPNDLLATCFQFLGMPLDLQYMNPSGRPTLMLDNGKPISELF